MIIHSSECFHCELSYPSRLIVDISKDFECSICLCFYVFLCWLFILLKTLNICVFFAVSFWCFLPFEVKTFDNVLKRSMEIFFFWWQRLKALILIFNVCRRERSTIYLMFNWSMGLFLLYSHIRSLFFKKNRTHQVELVSWWWLFGEARTTHQTIYQSWGGGIIRLWNVVKVTFWKQSFNTTAFTAIYLLLMSECSSMAQGGEKGESIEDLVCFFFNKISTSISFGSIIGSLTHFLGLWWSAFVPTSTILLLVHLHISTSPAILIESQAQGI